MESNTVCNIDKHQMEKKTVVIIGIGLIGQQWSMLFAAKKFNVFVYEICSSQIDAGKLQIQKNLTKFIGEGICRSTESCEEQLCRIKFTSILTELPKNAEFVMECVPENVELKIKIFTMLDSYFERDTVRMSSSSYIPVSKFTSNLTNRDKCIIAHPVNPPYFLRLVELVPAPFTDKSTTEKVTALMENLGQVTIELKKESEGFVLNRIQAAVYNSVFNLLRNGIVSVADIDKILTEGLAPRWTFYGPMLISALNGPGSENYFHKYLTSLDNVNNDQGYPPQHDETVIDTIVDEMKKYDSQMLSKINESRDSLLGQVLNIKMKHKND